MNAKCPMCKEAVQIGGSFFPFCSERCKLIDLGKWANESYTVPAVEPPTEDIPAGQGLQNSEE